MRQAIGYIRVSTHKQAASGFGMDAQRAQIEAYAQNNGCRIKIVISDVASAMGDGAGRSGPFHQALALAKQNGWPVIVASLDRIVRDTRRFEEILRDNYGVTIISAKHGKDADPIVIRAEVARAQREGEMISERTTRALAKKKAEGVPLGNRTNLAEAQRKGAKKNRALAAHRSAEFDEMLRLVRKDGASSAAEITAALNERGFRTARGGPWKVSNVHRMLKRTGAAAPASMASAGGSKTVLPSAPKPIFDDDSYILPDGRRRVRQIMALRNIEMGVVMKELGRKALDPSLGIALRHRSRFNDPKLFDWVCENEKALGLS